MDREELLESLMELFNAGYVTVEYDEELKAIFTPTPEGIEFAGQVYERFKKQNGERRRYDPR